MLITIDIIEWLLLLDVANHVLRRPDCNRGSGNRLSNLWHLGDQRKRDPSMACETASVNDERTDATDSICTNYDISPSTCAMLEMDRDSFVVVFDAHDILAPLNRMVT